MLNLRHCGVGAPVVRSSRLSVMSPQASPSSSSGRRLGSISAVPALPLRRNAASGLSSSGAYNPLRPSRLTDGGSGGGSDIAGSPPRSRTTTYASGPGGSNPLAPLAAAINNFLNAIISIISGVLNTLSSALLSLYNLLAANLWAVLVLLGLFEVAQAIRGEPGLIIRRW